jgi:hypothetical protein
MDKKEKILELKLKVIELGLERDKYTHKTLFSGAIAIITFALTSQIFLDSVKQTLVQSLVSLISFNTIIGLIIMFAFVLGITILAYYLSSRLTDIFFKTANNMFNSRIKEIKKLIEDLE